MRTWQARRSGGPGARIQCCIRGSWAESGSRLPFDVGYRHAGNALWADTGSVSRYMGLDRMGLDWSRLSWD